MPDDKPRSLISRWLLIEAPWIKNPHPTAAGIVTAVLGILALGLSVVLLVLLVRLFGRVFGAEIPTEELRNILIAIGALIGAPFLVWRTWVAHVAARANDEQARIARESLYTTLFTKAVEHLGATREVKDGSASKTEPNIEVRLGAIHALRRIAQESTKDHWPIMESLSAYVVSAAIGPGLSSEQHIQAFCAAENTWQNWQHGVVQQLRDKKTRRPDVAAALKAIGTTQVNRAADLYIQKGLITPQALRLSFAGCSFIDFDFQELNLSHCYFSNCLFINCKFTDVNLNRSTFLDCVFTSKTRLANIIAIESSFLQCHFYDSMLIASRFDRGTFGSNRLTHCWLSQSHWRVAEISGTVFSDCNFVKSDFGGAGILHCRFDRTRLERILFSRTVSGVGEVVGALGGADRREGRSDGVPEGFAGSCGDGS